MRSLNNFSYKDDNVLEDYEPIRKHKSIVQISRNCPQYISIFHRSALALNRFHNGYGDKMIISRVSSKHCKQRQLFILKDRNYYKSLNDRSRVRKGNKL
jgi:hypothetical protein